MLKQVLKLEWLIFSRSQGQWLYPVMFFILVLCLFVMGIDPEDSRLLEMAPAVIWCAYLLSLLLALDHLWRDDYQNGVLEQLLINTKHPLRFLFLRCLIRWMYSILPLLLALPLALQMLNVPLHSLFLSLISLVLGSLSFWLLGACLSALTLGDKRSSLTSLLLLPLSVPLLIFGSRMMKFAVVGEDVSGIVWLLSGVTVLALSCAPWLIHAAIKLNID